MNTPTEPMPDLMGDIRRIQCPGCGETVASKLFRGLINAQKAAELLLETVV